MLFMKRFRNSSRTVEVPVMVFGDRPRERQPRHCGSKSIQGMRWPRITSGAILKEVVTVQKIGKRQMIAQKISAP